MVIRLFWKNCDFCHGGDAVWVEATEAEAALMVFPHLSDEAVATSKTFANRSGRLAGMMGRPHLTFCFLVATNLSLIRPFEVHYPFHQLWNAYSPFQAMPEVTIATLNEVCRIDLPEGNQGSD